MKENPSKRAKAFTNALMQKWRNALLFTLKWRRLHEKKKAEKEKKSKTTSINLFYENYFHELIMGSKISQVSRMTFFFLLLFFLPITNGIP